MSVELARIASIVLFASNVVVASCSLQKLDPINYGTAGDTGVAGDDNGTSSSGGAESTGGRNGSSTKTSQSGGAKNTNSSSTGGDVALGGDSSTGGHSNSTVSTMTGGSTNVAGATNVDVGVRFVPSANSCNGSTLTCQSESCCTSVALSAAQFPMGRSESSSGADYSFGKDSELPEHQVSLTSFALDRYEVTVGRFRKFVENYDIWHKQSKYPQTGDGKHPVIPNTGWGQSWSVAATDLPADADALRTALKCDSGNETWSDSAVSSLAESYPINCVNWFIATAFCIWDGGRLPTEAEREYAAAGGNLNRLYPWGAVAPDASRANFSASDNSPRVSVGSKAANGQGYFSHLDLAGSVSEWIFDWFLESFYTSSAASIPCKDCANTSSGVGRVIRDGGWYLTAINLRAASRFWAAPELADAASGIRCARAVP